MRLPIATCITPRTTFEVCSASPSGSVLSLLISAMFSRQVISPLHLRIIGTQRCAICRHNCRPSTQAQLGQNQNCLTWKVFVWSEWQDLNLRPPRPERSTRPPVLGTATALTLLIRAARPRAPQIPLAAFAVCAQDFFPRASPRNYRDPTEVVGRTPPKKATKTFLERVTTRGTCANPVQGLCMYRKVG